MSQSRLDENDAEWILASSVIEHSREGLTWQHNSLHSIHAPRNANINTIQPLSKFQGDLLPRKRPWTRLVQYYIFFPRVHQIRKCCTPEHESSKKPFKFKMNVELKQPLVSCLEAYRSPMLESFENVFWQFSLNKYLVYSAALTNWPQLIKKHGWKWTLL